MLSIEKFADTGENFLTLLNGVLFARLSIIPGCSKNKQKHELK
jgi:hypothetical protein